MQPSFDFRNGLNTIPSGAPGAAGSITVKVITENDDTARKDHAGKRGHVLQLTGNVCCLNSSCSNIPAVAALKTGVPATNFTASKNKNS